jgi:hypothetical protein
MIIYDKKKIKKCVNRLNQYIKELNLNFFLLLFDTKSLELYN